MKPSSPSKLRGSSNSNSRGGSRSSNRNGESGGGERESGGASGSESGGWSCLLVIALVLITNIFTLGATSWYFKIRTTTEVSSSIAKEIANILHISHQSSQRDNNAYSTATTVAPISTVITPNPSASQISNQNENMDSIEVLLKAPETALASPEQSTPQQARQETEASQFNALSQTLQKTQKPQRPHKLKQAIEPPANEDGYGKIRHRVVSDEDVSPEPIPMSVLGKYTKVRPADRQPVLGKIPTNGTKPLWGFNHKGQDAIFALATNYPTLFYKRFVGSLRKSNYDGDIVLAVSPPNVMKDGVEEYLQKTHVLAYPFEVVCQGIDNCMFKENFLGYPDPRPMRTFANIRYALYEYWLTNYNFNSYILILDFRDTFFQVDPFLSFGKFSERQPKYELQVYEENYKVKNIGKCKFNSLWVGRCFGKPALKELREFPVLCSGSTLGSYLAVWHYVKTMLSSMDKVKCWLKGIESDQGYQNYLYYNGYFDIPELGKAIAFSQGYGVVNTIGAMNGFRVPKNETGPLDTFWKIRDKKGYILNNDGTKSACVHQWDRWYKELVKFIDSTTF